MVAVTLVSVQFAWVEQQDSFQIAEGGYPLIALGTLITVYIMMTIKENDLLDKIKKLLSQNTLFKHFFDNLEESVIMFQDE